MSQPKPNLSYTIAAILPPIVWGFFAIPLRNLSAYSADTILYYRLFMSLLLTGVVILLFRRKSLRADRSMIRALPPGQRKQLFFLITASTLLLTVNWLSFIYVVNAVSLQAAAFAYMVCPIITALFGYFLLGEEISPRKWLAIAVSMISVLILAWGFLLEVAWSVGVALSFALYLVIQRKISGIDKFNLLGVQLLLASLLVLPVFIGQEPTFPTDTGFWANIILVSLLFTVVPLYLNLYALIRMPSSTVGILIYINPIVALLVAFLYFGDQASLLQVASYLVLLIAVVLFNWGNLSRLRKRPR